MFPVVYVKQIQRAVVAAGTQTCAGEAEPEVSVRDWCCEVRGEGLLQEHFSTCVKVVFVWWDTALQLALVSHTLICQICSLLKYCCWIIYNTNLAGVKSKHEQKGLPSFPTSALYSFHSCLSLIFFWWESVRVWVDAVPAGTVQTEEVRCVITTSCHICAVWWQRDLCTYKAKEDKMAQANLSYRMYFSMFGMCVYP